MIAIDNLYHIVLPSIKIFCEDVRFWLDFSSIPYIPNVELTGNSGYDHRVDFVILKSNI